MVYCTLYLGMQVPVFWGYAEGFKLLITLSATVRGIAFQETVTFTAAALRTSNFATYLSRSPTIKCQFTFLHLSTMKYQFRYFLHISAKNFKFFSYFSHASAIKYQFTYFPYHSTLKYPVISYSAMFPV